MVWRGISLRRLRHTRRRTRSRALVQLLVACGALVGRGAWFEVEATRHYANEFAVLVGDSALSRKGSALVML